LLTNDVQVAFPDIDWEYPNFNGNPGVDKNNFVLLLQALKLKLGTSFTVSTAIGAGSWRTGISYDIPGIFANADFVNLMTCEDHLELTLTMTPI
jgi:GH18 family chitinase